MSAPLSVEGGRGKSFQQQQLQDKTANDQPQEPGLKGEGTVCAFSIPDGTWGLGLVRRVGDDCWMYEPVRYVRGTSGVNQELRRLAAVGGLAAGPTDYLLDFYDETGDSILGEVSLTRVGYDEYRRCARPRRVYPERTP